MVDWPPFRLLITGLSVTILTYFSIGYQYSVMNVAHDVFLDFINGSYVAHYAVQPSKPYLAMLWSITVSLWQAGAMIGSLCSCIAEERCGRKFTLLVIGGVTQITGSLLMATAPVINMFELLAAGRFVSGISSGLVGPTLRVFLCECSPNKYRGTMNSFGGIVMSMSCVVALVLGQSSALGTKSMLPYLLGLCVVPSLVQFFIHPFIPASPKYLYMHKSNHVAAVRSLYYYYGNNVDVSRSFREFEQEKNLTQRQLSLCQTLRTRTVLFPLLLSFLLGLANSSIGIDIVDSYSTEIFVHYGMFEEYAKKSSILFNIPGMVGGVLATLFIVDRCGRRPLLISTLFLCVLCNGSFLGLGLYSKYFAYSSIVGVGVVVTTCLLAFAYGIGPGAVVESLFAEICPQTIRSVAGSISEFSFYSSNVIYVLLFPPLLTLIGPYVFLIHAIPLLVCTIIFCFKLPETSRRSIVDIVAEMNDENDDDSPSTSTTSAAIRSTFSSSENFDDHRPLVLSAESRDFSYGSISSSA